MQNERNASFADALFIWVNEINASLLFSFEERKSLLESRSRRRRRRILYPFFLRASVLLFYFSYLNFSEGSSLEYFSSDKIYSEFGKKLKKKEKAFNCYRRLIDRDDKYNPRILSRLTTFHALKRKVHSSSDCNHESPCSPAAKLEATTSPSQFVFSILERNRISISQGRLITVEPTRDRWVPRFTARHVIRTSSNTAA